MAKPPLPASSRKTAPQLPSRRLGWRQALLATAVVLVLGVLALLVRLGLATDEGPVPVLPKLAAIGMAAAPEVPAASAGEAPALAAAEPHGPPKMGEPVGDPAADDPSKLPAFEQEVLAAQARGDMKPGSFSDNDPDSPYEADRIRAAGGKVDDDDDSDSKDASSQ